MLTLNPHIITKWMNERFSKHHRTKSLEVCLQNKTFTKSTKRETILNISKSKNWDENKMFHWKIFNLMMKMCWWK